MKKLEQAQPSADPFFEEGDVDTTNNIVASTANAIPETTPIITLLITDAPLHCDE